MTPSPSTTSATLISSEAELAPIVERLRAEGCAAVDTEFVWTRTYFPQLGVVQLGADDGDSWVVDATSAGPSLASLLADPATVKILHDARQDLSLLAGVTGAQPVNIFDTRHAAGFAGFSTTISLKLLLAEVLGVDLPKTETRTDWTRRPLSPAQVEYALNDVRHLGKLRRLLLARAAELGTADWLEDDMRQLDDPALYAPADPANVWRRIKGAGRLALREQRRLCRLATRREQYAMEWNMPRNWVVEDGSLIDIARQPPDDTGHAPLRHRLSRQRLESFKRDIADTLRAEAQEPPPDPARGLSQRNGNAARELVESALDYLRRRAGELRLAPELYGSRGEVAAFVESPGAPHSPLATGWRHDTAGRELAQRCGQIPQDHTESLFQAPS